MKKLAIISAIITLGIGLLSAPLVVARDGEGVVDSAVTVPVKPDDIDKRLERREARAEKRCEIVKARLQAVGERADSVRERRNQRYGNIDVRLDKLLERLELAGADTTLLSEQLDELNDLVIEFQATFGEFHSTVLSAASASCDEDANLRELIDDAKDLRSNLKTQAQNIREYINTEIKPTLADLKSDLATTDDSSEGED